MNTCVHTSVCPCTWAHMHACTSKHARTCAWSCRVLGIDTCSQACTDKEVPVCTLVDAYTIKKQTCVSTECVRECECHIWICTCHAEPVVCTHGDMCTHSDVYFCSYTHAEINVYIHTYRRSGKCMCIHTQRHNYMQVSTRHVGCCNNACCIAGTMLACMFETMHSLQIELQAEQLGRTGPTPCVSSQS